MAKKIRGIVIEIEGKTDSLVKSLDAVNKDLKTTQSQLKEVQKALKLDPGNTKILAQQQKLLKEEIKDTSEKLKLEKKAAEDAKEALKLGKISQEEYRALNIEVMKTEAELKNLKNEAKQNKKELLGLGDSAKKSGEDASKAAEAWKKFGSVVASALGEAVKMTAAATTAIAGATTALVTSAVQGYSELEQVEGGIEKLFGSDAQTVIANANDAFKTAGMSATEYMSTATGISAALINSLGGDTAKAAEMADTAIRAMSDNASIFGTDLSSIQSAFMGFARGNFSMLDSLSLGYGGTKEGMVQLINDSGILQEKIENLDDISFAQMVEAIDAVQNKMGIAGNTANEAFGTIGGSIAATQSAWKNFVAGLADPRADLGQLVGNLVDSALAALDNIKPAVMRALEGIKTALPMLSGILQEVIPDLLTSLLPPLISATADIFSELAKSLPDLLTSITEVLPGLISQVIDAVTSNIDLVISCVMQLIMVVVNTLLDSNNLKKVLDAAVNIVLAIVEGIANNVDELIPAVLEAIGTVAETLLKPDNIEKIAVAAVELVVGIGKGLIRGIPDLLVKVAEVVDNIASTLKSCWDKVIEGVKYWGADLIDTFVSGIRDNFGKLVSTMDDFAGKIAERIHFSCPDVGPLSDADEYGGDFVELIANGIDRNLDKMKRSVNGMALTMESGVKNVDYSSALNGISSQLGGIANNRSQAVNVYIGNEKLGTAITKSNTRSAFLAGGR